jgi:type I restriction enzyme, R subunit
MWLQAKPSTAFARLRLAWVPNPAAIEKEADKKAFAKLFGEYLRIENVLQNYDEFASLKELQSVDVNDPAA